MDDFSAFPYCTPLSFLGNVWADFHLNPRHSHLGIPNHLVQPRHSNVFACCRNAAAKQCLPDSVQYPCPTRFGALGLLEWWRVIAKPMFGCKLPCSSRVKETDLGFRVESARLVVLAGKQKVVHTVKLGEDVFCGWHVITQESSQD